MSCSCGLLWVWLCLWMTGVYCEGLQGVGKGREGKWVKSMSLRKNEKKKTRISHMRHK